MSAIPSTVNSYQRQSATSRKLASRLALVGNTVVFECPASRSIVVSSLVVANTSTSRISFRLFHLLPTESAATSNALLYDVVLEANSSLFLDSRLNLNAGDKVVAYASTTNVVAVTLYGEER
jgi:hypothetical protein